MNAVVKTPLRLVRDVAAETLRRLPISSEWLGPPKDEDATFQAFLARGSAWTKNAREMVVFSAEAVDLPAAAGVFGFGSPRFLAAESYVAPEAAIYECPNVRIFTRPLGIITPDDRLLVCASCWHSPKARSHFAFHQVWLGRARPLAGSSLYLGGNRNPWHFYGDFLRQMVALQRAGQKLENFDHVFAKKPETPIERFFYDALGLTGRHLVDGESERQFRCERLTFFSSVSRYHGRAELEEIRNLVFRVTGMPAQPRARRRIYVSRSRAHFRRVLNEPELLAWLNARGFETLHLEEMSPTNQIEAFRDADVVVGAHGAGLAHLLFSAPTTTVVELRNPAFVPENGAADTFRVVSGIRGLRYFAVTPRHHDRAQDPHHDDFSIDLADLQAALAAAGVR